MIIGMILSHTTHSICLVPVICLLQTCRWFITLGMGHGCFDLVRDEMWIYRADGSLPVVVMSSLFWQPWLLPIHLNFTLVIIEVVFWMWQYQYGIFQVFLDSWLYRKLWALYLTYLVTTHFTRYTARPVENFEIYVDLHGSGDLVTVAHLASGGNNDTPLTLYAYYSANMAVVDLFWMSVTSHIDQSTHPYCTCRHSEVTVSSEALS